MALWNTVELELWGVLGGAGSLGTIVWRWGVLRGPGGPWGTWLGSGDSEGPLFSPKYGIFSQKCHFSPNIQHFPPNINFLVVPGLCCHRVANVQNCMRGDVPGALHVWCCKEKSACVQVCQERRMRSAVPNLAYA